MKTKADATSLVALTDIQPNPWNPHRMTEQEMNDLIESLRSDGQWRPILVVEMDQPDDQTQEIIAPYRIVDGEHLWRAMVSRHMSGETSNQAKVMVLGKNSEIDITRQMDIGQTINHGLRGSQEDPEKTRKVLQEILKRRAPEVVAKRLGLGVTGVKHLANLSGTTAPKRTVGGSPAAAAPKGGLSGAIKSTTYGERKNYTLALVFETAEEMEEFEEAVETLAKVVGVDDREYKGRRGQRRIAVLRAAVNNSIRQGVDDLELLEE